MKVDVCVVSYRRPQGLLRLLGGLQALRLPAPAPDVRIVVVDNDPAESARGPCAEAEGWLRFPLVYAVEKRRGIPQARNAALALALERAEWVAFLDDDEVPDPDWLAALLRVSADTGADVVTGPCLPVFAEPPPAWIESGRLFERPRFATGTCLPTAATNNVLASAAVLAGLDRLFDERMALTGGSDDELFRRLAQRGGTIVWADEARVSEWVPASRATFAWLMRRQFRVGTATTLAERRLGKAPPSVAWHLAHALWCLARGGTRALAALPRGRGPAVAELRLAAFAAGRLAGLLGVVHEEYRTLHGA
ncbi:MAG: glycosyltransferase family 2 protein [Myxococcota bacterium]|nr:glycosyltransferase family 2 protein [Myxococcota bacterium]